jgi:DNA topoisomerase-1
MYHLIQLGKGTDIKWNTMEHNGVLFPLKYKPHNLPVLYRDAPSPASQRCNAHPLHKELDGTEIQIYLTPKQEEAATLYAKFIDTKYIKSRVFRRNFWKNWKKILGKNHQIKSLDNCDFKSIYKFIIEQRELKRNLTKEQKELIKTRKGEQEEKYKFAIIDNNKVPVSNFRVEPPGIFLGRGCSLRLGKIKRRIYPEDITLNLSKDAPVPALPENMSDHKWGEIIHDQTVEWLASWKDEITGKTKYVWLSAKSEQHGEKDRKKYDKARILKKKIGKIRKQYYEDMTQTKDLKLKQMATALYLIDNFALRIGNEKSKEEADTVGAASLRVEHLELLPIRSMSSTNSGGTGDTGGTGDRSDEDRSDDPDTLTDSDDIVEQPEQSDPHDSRRHKTSSGGSHDSRRHETSSGGSHDSRRHETSSGGSQESGLPIEPHVIKPTKYKIKLDFLSKDSVRYAREAFVDKIVYGNMKLFMSNKQSNEDVFDKIKPVDLNEYLKQFMTNLTTKVFRTYNASNLFQNELAKATRKCETCDVDDKVNMLLDEFNRANLAVAIKCNHQKEVSKNFSDQVKKINTRIKMLRKKKIDLKKKKIKDRKKKKERSNKIDKQISVLKSRKSLKVELKNYSLGTSKTNYIDPRITVAFMKRHDIPIDKLFTKTLQEKFAWAMDTPIDYKF